MLSSMCDIGHHGNLYQCVVMLGTVTINELVHSFNSRSKCAWRMILVQTDHMEGVARALNRFNDGCLKLLSEELRCPLGSILESLITCLFRSSSIECLINKLTSDLVA